MCPGGFPIAESQNWQSAFLPGIYQGTYIDSKHTEIEKLIAHIRNRGVWPRAQAPSSTCWPSSTGGTWTTGGRGRARGADPVVRAGLPDAVGGGRRLRHHPGAAPDPRDVRSGVHARQLLVTRRLLERGVRFVQLWHGDGQPWDHHDDLETGHRELANSATGRSGPSSRT